MSKRRASAEAAIEPDAKKHHTEEIKTEEVPVNEEQQKVGPLVSMRLLVSRSLGDAMEEPEKGLLHKLKDNIESLAIGEKVQGSPDRVLTSSGAPSQLAEVLASVAEFIGDSNMGKHIPGTDPVVPAPPPPRKTRGRAPPPPTSAPPPPSEQLESLKTYWIRLLVPDHIAVNALQTSLAYGKTGKLTRIANESKAKLELSRSQLPASTDRSMVVRGSLAEIKTAVESLAGVFLNEQQSAKYYPAISYIPRVVTGIYGHPDTFQRQMLNQSLAATNPYLIPASEGGPVSQGMDPGAAIPDHSVSGAGNTAVPNSTGDDIAHITAQGGMQQAQKQAQAAIPGQQLTQQIYIPNDMVGAIIGKGGTKINEIRQMSGSMIRINEPNEEVPGGAEAGPGGATGPSGTERMVTITGTPESNQMALYLLYQRIESERHHHSKK